MQILVLALSAMPRAHADTPSESAQGASGGQQCRAAIALAERVHAIPTALLAAIGDVESGRRDARTGRIDPWPWTVNAEGQGHFYPTEAAAIAAVQALQARGVRSIDVGCIQVNLLHHPHAFASLQLAFDPATNADFAARFLRRLHAQTQSWPQATAAYHSATPVLGQPYEQKVMQVWPKEMQLAGTTPALAQIRSSLSGGGFGAGAIMLSNHPERARIIPLAAGPGGMHPGKGLASYRAMPIAIATVAGG